MFIVRTWWNAKQQIIVGCRIISMNPPIIFWSSHFKCTSFRQVQWRSIQIQIKIILRVISMMWRVMMLLLFILNKINHMIIVIKIYLWVLFCILVIYESRRTAGTRQDINIDFFFILEHNIMLNKWNKNWMGFIIIIIRRTFTPTFH